MEVIALPVQRYRMGAEELIELGRGRPVMGGPRTPFLSNRGRYILGTCGHAYELGAELGGQVRAELGDLLDIVKDIGGVITGALGFALTTLGDLVNVPLNILSQGIDITFNGVASLLDHIPIIGGLLSQILLLGNSVIKFALSVPGMLLHGLGNIMTGISKALLQKNTPAENQKNVDKAKSDIVGKAPPNLQDKVLQALNSSGVTGTNLTPSLGTTPGANGGTTLPGTTPPPPSSGSSGVSDALAIGLPVAAVGVAALLFAT